MHFKISLTLLFAIITVNNSENKFGTFRNATKSSQNQGSDDHIDQIKKEIKKYMSECGADVSNEDSSESQYNNNNNNNNRNSSSSSSGSNSNNNGGDYYNSGRYDNRDQNNQNRGTSGYWNQNSNNQRSTTTSGYGQSYGNSGSNRDYSQTGYGSWGSSGSGQGYSSPHGSMDSNRSGYGNGNYGYGHQSSDYGNRNTDSMSSGRRSDYGSGSYGSGRDSFNFDGGYVRPKRSEDDIECISQCVFGYLEVLDDNRSPSESAMIKWLQDHLPNDGKRIKAIRDNRRCFARLAASDNEDGCEFSKSLSKCLNLEIEK